LSVSITAWVPPELFASAGILGFPGCVEVQLVRVRTRQIKTKDEARDDGLGKGEARRGRQPDEKSFRDEHRIFVIGQWSFVIGHLLNAK
jgi:hypothetical protein